MKRLLTISLLLITLVIATTSLLMAQGSGEVFPLNPAPSADSSEMINETTNRYFVELAGTRPNAACCRSR